MRKRAIVIGGGAAGFFGAITCAEANPEAEVIILEKSPEFLQKVKISGGGRCNVTHACFDPRELTRRYPRGERELIGPFHQFQAEDTVRWFEARGVKLKTERDGRMFPVTDNSRTVIDCLMRAAREAGVRMRANSGASTVARTDRGFVVTSNAEEIACDTILLATGGCRTTALGALAVSLGHTLEPPVPSLFTFHIEVPWVRSLAGVSVQNASVWAADIPPSQGAVLFTHWGLSGPAILRLSAWGARALHGLNYRFPLWINWTGGTAEKAREELLGLSRSQPAKLVANTPAFGIPSRLWSELVRLAGVPPGTRWSALGRPLQNALIEVLTRMELPVSGKSLNKDEFVTAGGVRLAEVNFKTMESKVTPGLFFAGELLDIDGITGGFNFQAAWTTGWIAGNAMAKALGN